MNTIKHLILLFSLSTLLSTSVYADPKGVIIVSHDVNIEKLSKDELERIFLGKTTIWENGKRIQIGLSIKNHEKANQFFKHYIGKNQRRFKKYWLKLVFAGYGIAPKIFKDDNKAVDFTKTREGVISFVSTQELDNMKDIKIVSIDGNLYF